MIQNLFKTILFGPDACLEQCGLTARRPTASRVVFRHRAAELSGRAERPPRKRFGELQKSVSCHVASFLEQAWPGSMKASSQQLHEVASETEWSNRAVTAAEILTCICLGLRKYCFSHMPGALSTIASTLLGQPPSSRHGPKAHSLAATWAAFELECRTERSARKRCLHARY
jgi:hypothetical protein